MRYRYLLVAASHVGQKASVTNAARHHHIVRIAIGDGRGQGIAIWGLVDKIFLPLLICDFDKILFRGKKIVFGLIYPILITANKSHASLKHEVEIS